MKNLMFLLLGIIISISLNAQDYTQQEVICPCMLEFEFPKSMEDGQGLLAAFGGVPVLRFAEAKVQGKKLICVYEKNFAKFYFDGFGYAKSNGTYGDFSGIPYDLTLTLNETLLHGWTPNRKTVKLPNYHRGCVVYTLDHCDDINKYAWNGGFYSSRYNGNQVILYRSFDDAARVNNTNTGFILAKTMSGLFTTTPIANPDIDNINKPVIKKKRPEVKKDNPVLKKTKPVLKKDKPVLSKKEIKEIKKEKKPIKLKKKR